MKKVGFIGALDKTDFILYIAKILVEMGEKVLLIDATITQKARYIVPNIQTSKEYITEFEGIDVAVGMKNEDEIKNYLSVPPAMDLPYDTVLIDTNSAGGVMSYRINECDKIFFATSMDMYSVKKGIESLSVVKQEVEVTKILFSKGMNKAEDDYIKFLSSGSNIVWTNETIYLPFELGDQTTIFKNQRVSKIRLRGLTTPYKEGLMYAANKIAGDENYMKLRRVFRRIEKSV